MDINFLFICARDGNRTRTAIADNRILSPARLPIPPPGQRGCKCKANNPKRQSGNRLKPTFICKNAKFHIAVQPCE